MDAFELADLTSTHRQVQRPYLEFLRMSSLSAGLYILPKDGVDLQQPHTEDEVYYIISGNGIIQVGIEEHVVKAGTVVFVEAGVEHRFHSITEELRIFVFFAPAEYSVAHQE